MQPRPPRAVAFLNPAAASAMKTFTLSLSVLLLTILAGCVSPSGTTQATDPREAAPLRVVDRVLQPDFHRHCSPLL